MKNVWSIKLVAFEVVIIFDQRAKMWIIEDVTSGKTGYRFCSKLHLMIRIFDAK